MRTDEQIVQETNDLARLMLSELVGTGYEAPEDHKFWAANDPRSQKAWATAVRAMELITKTEVEDALNNYLAELDAQKSRRYMAPNGCGIVGTLETLPACSPILGIRSDGTPEHDNSVKTEIYWDDQKTAEADGKILFLCEDGKRWTFDQLTVIEDSADDE